MGWPWSQIHDVRAFLATGVGTQFGSLSPLTMKPWSVPLVRELQTRVLRDVVDMIQCVTRSQSRGRDASSGHRDALYGAQNGGDNVDPELESALRD
jgi:hypothetical protein